jgi:hypothetical protein
MRQEQLYDELREAERRGEPTTAAHLAQLMYVHRGVGRSQTYDLLGALHKKGVVGLAGREWHLASPPHTEKAERNGRAVSSE